jgi:hypothetical protein
MICHVARLATRGYKLGALLAPGDYWPIYIMQSALDESSNSQTILLPVSSNIGRRGENLTSNPIPQVL